MKRAYGRIKVAFLRAFDEFKDRQLEILRIEKEAFDRDRN